MLSKIIVRRNPNYAASGTKSYVYMLRKWGFKPSLAGPYQRHEQQHGGHQRGARRLRKHNADGTTGAVTSQDQQNDSLYLTTVAIGTPAQELPVGKSDAPALSSSLLYCTSQILNYQR